MKNSDLNLSVPEKMVALGESRSVIRDLFEYANTRKAEIGADKVFDFSLGNPSVPSPAKVNETLIRLISDTDSTLLHGYTSSAGCIEARRAIAAYENRRAASYCMTVSAENVYITCGAAASLTISLTALICPGDKIALLAPFFPEYKVFAEKAGAEVVVIPPTDESMLPDFDALECASRSGIKALIINSPNNPSGAVYSRAVIERIAEILRAAEKERGETIFLISDEPYRELVYGDAEPPFVPALYENTLICYSYSKSLSLPGERIGYILVSPDIQNGAATKIFAAVCGAGRALGYVCAPSLFQRMVAECAEEKPDICAYDKNRRIIYNELTRLGFVCTPPDGAFYLFIKSPVPDAREFCEAAKRLEIMLVPSDSFGIGGYARLAYCVSEQTIRSSLPAFAALAKLYFN